MPLAGINLPIELSKPPYINFEEPIVCHSIVAKCVNLSAGFQVNLVTSEYEDKGNAHMSSSESELGITLLIVVFWFGTHRVA
jgi:hypothetical protein